VTVTTHTKSKFASDKNTNTNTQSQSQFANSSSINQSQTQTQSATDYISHSLEPKPKQKQNQKQKQSIFLLLFFKWLMIFVCMYGLTIGMAELVFNKLMILSIVLSMFGACFRWYLGKMFNFRKLKFHGFCFCFADTDNDSDTDINGNIPTGTLIANVLASVISIFVSLVFGNPGCYISTSVNDGLCGCLSTISSFVAEVAQLVRNAIQMDNYQIGCKFAVFYILITISLSQLFTAIVFVTIHQYQWGW
jgi:fluoride ion exporter CrcB/FEX